MEKLSHKPHNCFPQSNNRSGGEARERGEEDKEEEEKEGKEVSGGSWSGLLAEN